MADVDQNKPEVVVLPRDALFEFLGEMALPPWRDNRGNLIGGDMECAPIAERLSKWVDGHDLGPAWINHAVPDDALAVAITRREQMTEVGRQIAELAELTPKGPIMALTARGNEMEHRASFNLSYDWHPGVGQDGGHWWTFEWEAVDAKRNFSMSGVTLPDLLDSAILAIRHQYEEMER